MTIQQARNERCRLHAEGAKLRAEGRKLHAEGYKLHAEGAKLHAEGRKLHAEGDKLYAEGAKLHAEGDLIFINAVIETHGPKAVIEYVDSTTVTVNGERYGYQQEKAEVVQEESPKVAIPDSKAFDANQLADLIAQKVWEAMPKIVRLDYETKEALNEYVRGKKDGAKEEHERAEKEKPGRHVSDRPMELRRAEVWERVEEAQVECIKRWESKLERLRKEASEAFEQMESLVEPDGAEEHGFHRGLSRALDILTGKHEALPYWARVARVTQDG